MAAARVDLPRPHTSTELHVLTARFSVPLPHRIADAAVRSAQAKATVAATLAVPNVRTEALPDLASLAAVVDIDAAPSATPAAAASAHRVVGVRFACSLSFPAATPAAGSEIQPQCHAALSAWITECLAAVWAPMDVAVVPHHLDQHAALDNPHRLILAQATDPPTRAFVATLAITTRMHFQRLFPRIFSAPYVTAVTKSATYLPTMATAMANILQRRQAAQWPGQLAVPPVPVPAADQIQPVSAAATQFDEADLITAATQSASADATTQLLYRLVRTAALKIRIPRPAPDWIARVASSRPGAPVDDDNPPPLNHSQHHARDVHGVFEPAWLAEIGDHAWEPLATPGAGGSQMLIGASLVHSPSLNDVNWEPLGTTAVDGRLPSAPDLACLAESMTQDDEAWEPLGRAGADPRDPLRHVGADARPPDPQCAKWPGFAESATFDDVPWVRVGPGVARADMGLLSGPPVGPESAGTVQDVDLVEDDNDDDLWDWQRVRDGVNVPTLPDLAEFAQRAAALAEVVEENEMAWEPLGHGRLEDGLDARGVPNAVDDGIEVD
ncbi:hypothetical protein GGF31_000970 [Allomyces arbusculus]|nr:hypothetical protein GGF31_000970 [Allomyces arbusculus]